MKKVVFIDSDHSYWTEKEGVMFKVPSVSEWVKPYFPFKRDYWLTNGSFKKLLGAEKIKEVKESLGYKGVVMPPADVLFPELHKLVDASDFFKEREILSNKWSWNATYSAYKGTAFHGEQEKKIIKDKGCINPFTGEFFKHVPFKTEEFDNESIADNLYDLKPGVYTELLVFHPKLLYAGQIDLCFIKQEGDRKHIWIDDWKTNEDKPSSSSYERALFPFNELYNCTHAEYSAKISMYAYALESSGFIVERLGYTHCPINSDSRELIEVDYLFEEISIILDEN